MSCKRQCGETRQKNRKGFENQSPDAILRIIEPRLKWGLQPLLKQSRNHPVLFSDKSKDQTYALCRVNNTK